MKYFLERTTGEVYAFSKSQIKKGLVLNTMVEMTDDEISDHLKPRIRDEQGNQSLQAKKDSLLAYATMKIDIINDAINLGIDVDNNKKNIINWREYRVKINSVDISSEGDVIWPHFYDEA